VTLRPLRLLTLALLPLATAHWPLAQPTPPAWAADAIGYQLFPERFANGDPTNDPTWASLDFPDRVDSAAWRPSRWTADWYARDDWERAMGPDFYEHGVFFRRYGGDLQGVLDRVDYLDSLGVTLVYVNPVFYAGSLHKYDAYSFHHIDPYFGPDPAGDLALIAQESPLDPATWTWTSADRLFLDLLAVFRARGIRVILDGVFNHTGERFWAFEDLRRRQQASPFADWYKVTRWDDPATPDTSEFDWEGWWGFRPLALFSDNADGTDLHPGVKAHVFAATRRWMDPDADGDPADGIAGWRLDVAEEVPAGFWRDWNALVRSLNPDAYTVAEVWQDAAHYLDETGFSATMNYHAFAIPVHDALADGRETAAWLGQRLADGVASFGPAAGAAFNILGSHDTDRVASMIVNGGLGANYDRAAGPRDAPGYSVRAPTAAERETQRMIVAWQMAAMPGVPVVYYGDEAGMWGADDPDSRKPMLWPDLPYADEAGDPRGRPRTPDRVMFDADLFGFYQRAIALRRSDATLRRGSFRVLASDSSALAVERVLGSERRVVALNRSNVSRFLALPRVPGAPLQPLVPIFASTGEALDVPALVYQLADDGSGTAGLRLPPRTTVVFRPAAPSDVRPRGLDE